MSARRGGSRQGELFPRSKRPAIEVDPQHPLVRMTDTLDWDELEERVESIRRKKLKNAAGRPPQLRALIGAVLLMATRRMPYRDAEDQIRHYAPARYLCGLTESDWTPDFTTIQDFTELLGEEGVKLLNEYVVRTAVKKNLADTTILVADTTAQEAAIPHPNEIGLMASFLRSAVGSMKKAGGAFTKVVQKTKGVVKAAKEKVRRYRLFAKTKEKQIPELYSIVRGKVGKAVEFGVMWGISRLGGGFLLGTMGRTRKQCDDSKYAIQAVENHRSLFGAAPRSYAYDRGGYSKENVAELKARGVRDVGLAPRERPTDPREGSCRRRDRSGEESPLRIPPTRGTVDGDDGCLRTARAARFQPEQADTGAAAAAGAAGASRVMIGAANFGAAADGERIRRGARVLAARGFRGAELPDTL